MGEKMKSAFFYLCVLTVITPIFNISLANGEQTYVYAPWRDSYRPNATPQQPQTQTSQSQPAQEKPCPFCTMKNANNDLKYRILLRTKSFYVKLNDFPYTRGHLLIIPFNHVKDIEYLTPAQRIEIIELLNCTQKILSTVLLFSDFNIGWNIGKGAGASIPGHLHFHIVPRVASENNFMATLGNTRVIDFDLDNLYKKLKPYFDDLKCPHC